MKSLFLALVVASLVASSALADTLNVNVYGMLNANIALQQGSNSADAVTARWRLNCDSCNFGLKGDEALSESAKLVWQVESALGFNGDTSLWGGYLGFRNTGVGFNGNFGTVMVGRWDTPFKALTMALEPTYGTGAGYMANIMDSVGLGAWSTDSKAVGTTPTGGAQFSPTSVADTMFDRRQDQSIWYVSPKFYNTTFTGMYSGNFNRNATMNPDLFSASLGYDDGMFLLGFGFEQHDDARVYGILGGAGAPAGYTAATFSNLYPAGGAVAPVNGTKDTGIKAMAGWRITENTLIGVAYSSLKYANHLASGDDSVSRPAYMASIQHNMNNLRFAVAYGKAGDFSCTRADGTDVSSACADTGAQQGVAKVAYAYTKRTETYLAYSKIWNGGNGSYNWINPEDAAGTVYGGNPYSIGMNPESFSIGIRHTF